MSANMFRIWIKSLGGKLLANGARSAWRKPASETGRQAGTKKMRPKLETLENRVVPTNYTVTLATDPTTSTAGTLRYGIVNATSGETISFASSLSGAAITLTSALSINTNLTITGLVPPTWRSAAIMRSRSSMFPRGKRSVFRA